MKMKIILVLALLASLSLIALPSLGSGDLGKARQPVQTADILSIGERSSIVLSGTIEKLNASVEPLQPASSLTVVIKISKVISGSEIVGSQQGHRATIILSRAVQPKVGTAMVFFGNPLFIGKSVTLLDVGEFSEREVSASGAKFEEAIQGRRDLPLRLAIRSSSAIFRGRVERIEPVKRNQREKEVESEHEPDWQVATVRVVNPIKGTTEGATMKVVFAASDDIIWFNSPKLKEGQEAIFITRKPAKGEEQMFRESGLLEFLAQSQAELITDQAALQHVAMEAKVRELVKKEIR